MTPPKPKQREVLAVQLMEMMEAVGITATISQGRRLADEVLDQYPSLLTTAGRRPWKRWSDEDLELLRRLYEDERLTISQIMRRTGRTRGQINGAVTRLNLTHGYRRGRPVGNGS